MYYERRRVICAHEKGNDVIQPYIDVLINVLVAFRQKTIKLGQFLSSRADGLP
jgi:hypothetical protein